MQTDGRIPEGTPADPQLSGEMLAKANLAFIFALDKNPYLNKWRDAKTYIALIFALISHLMKILLSSILLSWDYTLLSRYH